MIDVRDWMQSVGLECRTPVVVDGAIHRFKDGGARRANSWYWFVEREGQVYGKCGDWKSGLVAKIGDDVGHRAIAGDLAEMREAGWAKAAERARMEWERAAMSGASAYLERKGIPGLGVRFGQRRILVPMFQGGRLSGVQRILDNGTKLFSKGCGALGACYTLGVTGSVTLVRVICEGYATAASLHLATGLPVTLAFSAGNLVPVANRVRAEHRNVRIIIASDNDRTPGNPGLTAARKAASAVNMAVVVYPQGIEGTDFNDAHLERGLDYVGESILAAL